MKKLFLFLIPISISCNVDSNDRTENVSKLVEGVEAEAECTNFVLYSTRLKYVDWDRQFEIFQGSDCKKDKLIAKHTISARGYDVGEWQGLMVFHDEGELSSKHLQLYSPKEKKIIFKNDFSSPHTIDRVVNKNQGGNAGIKYNAPIFDENTITFFVPLGKEGTKDECQEMYDYENLSKLGVPGELAQLHRYDLRTNKLMALDKKLCFSEFNG